MPESNPTYTPETQGPYDLISIGRLELEEGGVIEDCQLAVATAGTLNDARDNAILIPTFYSGTHHTWFESYIGPDHALDPTRYFIISVNQIGNGLSTSPNNVDDPAITGPRFPRIRIGDDVIAQERLIREHFGIEKLALVVGGSMGAQQVWEWAVRFPDTVLRAAPIAGTAQNTPHDFLFTQTLIDAITSDPGFAGGEYASHTDVADGLRRHARILGTMGFSTEFFKTRFHAAMGMETLQDFLDGFLEPYCTALDPNSLLTMAWKWQRGDVARNADGDLAAALGRVTADLVAMPISEDMFFPVRDVAADAALVPGAQVRVIDDIVGHMALFAVNPTFMPQIDHALRELLAR
ncbi:alpha/beta fold hydrolase [Williamsia sp. CHRR-6]|uniref:alpha/beta fold hydrolase n=1 Tax=Williamsia sp. CHRR-6 TaxID=2835871 RepID=UPI001BD9D2E9|nr:alpha/beta fold hydrolase [Williamsia sp. CHRR-6]MBT0566582.1 alpha/beta fold hydrolase [Williamsia sp. CHRR-6]